MGKGDLEGCLRKICSFLGWMNWDELNESDRSKILEFCSFDWMKTNVDKFNRTNPDQDSVFKPDGFIRRGKVGDHKIELTEEQQKRIIDHAHSRLPKDCLDFVGI